MIPSDISCRQANQSASYPVFGTSSTPLSEVLQFYGSWSSFTTSRSFAAVDQYDTHDANSRFARRAMQKENNKIRTDTRKQYNRTVAQLVDFVRKFDPRYKEAKEQQQREEQQREEERKRRQEEEKRRREDELRANMQTQVTQVVKRNVWNVDARNGGRFRTGWYSIRGDRNGQSVWVCSVSEDI